jgi:hypothetical protein
MKAFEARRLARESPSLNGDCRTRRTWIKLWIPAMIAFRAAEGKDFSMFQQILEASLSEKKSVNIYIGGQSLGGGVVKLNADTVEIRSREYSRIVIRLESIDAVALA